MKPNPQSEFGPKNSNPCPECRSLIHFNALTGGYPGKLRCKKHVGKPGMTVVEITDEVTSKQ